MAQIDSFLARLTESRAQRATFHSDAPLQVQHATGNTDGSVTTAEQVQTFLEEILPPELKSQWEVQGQTSFTYAAPSGLFQMNARRTDGRIHLEMIPANVLPAGNPPVQPPPNDSGTGPKAVLPAPLRGFNLGAFLLSWIWAIGNRSWLGLLALLPGIGFFLRFWLGFKGNQMAWQNRKWDSYEQFKKTQTSWMIAGIVLVGIGILLAPINMAIFFPVFARARENARRDACQTNLHRVAQAVILYQSDNHGFYPPYTTSEEWEQVLKKYELSHEAFVCPSVQPGKSSYAFNTDLAGHNQKELQSAGKTPLVFDSEARHLDGANVAFADGSIHWFHGKALDQAMSGG
jgi:prepilin-type processing-associated H-X9-DG protein